MESEFVAWLSQRIPPADSLALGIGDDAAVVKVDSQRTVVTSDMLMDGIDFHLAACDPRLVGRKALAVNLSDLAAMAARPTAAIISLAIPSGTELAMLQQIYEGILDLAGQHDVAIAGGDTNCWAHPLVISVTALGEPTAAGVLTRVGARLGDAILVTGRFGGSILGRHMTFTPRVTEALELHRRYTLHAGIDVSDGLSLDLHRMMAASGRGALIDLSAIPISADAFRLAEQDKRGASALEHALGDGEDFELILAVPPESVEGLLADEPLSIPLTRIGEVVREPGLWRLASDGRRVPLQPRGYEHS